MQHPFFSCILLDGDDMKKKDIIVILVLSVIIGIGYLVMNFIQKDKDTVEVYFKNEVIETIDLSKDSIYTYKGSYGTFNLEVKEGKYHAVNVECPNHDCEKVGWVQLGQTKEIVCVPNEIYVIQTKTDGLY